MAAQNERRSSSDLENSFRSAAAHLARLSANVDQTDLLFLYARFKQAREGKCRSAKPAFWDLTGREKWSAWMSLGEMSKRDAMEQYVKKIDALDPSWQTKQENDDDDDDEDEEENQVDEKTPRRGFCVGVSIMRSNDEPKSDEAKTPFDWVKDDDLERLKGEKQLDLDAKDAQGLTLLHWAADRGHSRIVKHLLDRGAAVNDRDPDGQTALHYACSCDHLEAVRILLRHGADVSLTDEEDKTAKDVSSDERVLQLLLESNN